MKRSIIIMLLALAAVMLPVFAFADVKVPEPHEYSIYYYNNDTSCFDSYAADWRNALKTAFEQKYVNEDGEEVFVQNFTDNYKIDVTCYDDITYKDLLGISGILRTIYSRNGLKQPPAYFGAGTKQSITDYGNQEAFAAECNSDEPIALTGEQFYMLEGNSIAHMELNVEPGVCGTEVKVNEGLPEDASPNTTASVHPVVTFDDDNFVFAKDTNSPVPDLDYSYWIVPDYDKGYFEFFDGKMTGGTEYTACVMFEPKFGSVFSLQPEYINVNNGKAVYCTMIDDKIQIYIDVPAVHDYDEGKVTKKPTLTEEGLKVYTCKGCGDTKEEVVAKLIKNTMKVSGKKVPLKAKTLKKKNVAISRKKAISLSANKGTVTYKKVSVTSKKYAKKFTVNKKNGTITAKKGLKKGKYTIKIQVKAAGTATYAPLAKNVKVTVVVK